LDRLSELNPKQKDKQLANALVKDQRISERDAVATISGLQPYRIYISINKLFTVASVFTYLQICNA